MHPVKSECISAEHPRILRNRSLKRAEFSMKSCLTTRAEMIILIIRSGIWYYLPQWRVSHIWQCIWVPRWRIAGWKAMRSVKSTHTSSRQRHIGRSEGTYLLTVLAMRPWDIMQERNIVPAAREGQNSMNRMRRNRPTMTVWEIRCYSRRWTEDIRWILNDRRSPDILRKRNSNTEHTLPCTKLRQREMWIRHTYVWPPTVPPLWTMDTGGSSFPARQKIS